MLKILTEAGYTYGFGHFYRTSSLCERAISEQRPVRMLLQSDEVGEASLKREYTQFVSWWDCEDYSQILDPSDVVVVDSYHVTLDGLKAIQNACRQMVVIDDNLRLPYENMTVLNPNYFAVYLSYPEGNGNTYCIGKEYTLLRSAFCRPVSRTVKEAVSDILITMGGTDVKGLTVKTIEILNQLRDETAILHVVITDAYQDADIIFGMLKENDRCYVNADAQTMADLMRKCDFACATAGGTTNELIRMQCPALVAVVADNQVLNVRYMKKAGCLDTFDPECAQTVSGMFGVKKRRAIAEKLAALSTEKTACDYVMSLLDKE